MRVKGVPRAKRARATSWWARTQRRSTKLLEGAHIEAEGSAQAVGIGVDAASVVGDADGAALGSGEGAEAEGAAAAAIGGSGVDFDAPPQDKAVERVAQARTGKRRGLVTRAA
jgi:hypothetical protein